MSFKVRLTAIGFAVQYRGFTSPESGIAKFTPQTAIQRMLRGNKVDVSSGLLKLIREITRWGANEVAGGLQWPVSTFVGHGNCLQSE